MPETVHYIANPADVPEGTLSGLFLSTVVRLEDRRAYGDTTYGEVKDIVRRGASALARSGLARGDRAAIISDNRMEWALADWSCLCAGVVDVPVYSTLPAAQVAYILKDSGASLVFVSDAEQLAKAREAAAGLPREIEIVVFDPDTEESGGSGEDDGSAPGDVRVTGWQDFLARGDDADLAEFEAEAARAKPEEVATLIYTSGTTGIPKGVMLTHNNLATNIWASGRALDIGPDDSTLSFLPLSHVLQRMVDYLFFASGCTITHGSIDTVAAEMRRLRPTVLVSVPRLYEKVHQKVMDAGGLKGRIVSWAAKVGRRAALCRERGARFPLVLRLQHGVADKLVFSKLRLGVGGRLRFFVSGGAALAPEINRFFLGAGITILEGYGLTETSPVTNVNTLDDFRVGTVGRPVPGTEIRIADDGEILIRGPQVMKGYYGLDEKTREAISDDGWFSTGDIGELSRDGFLRITDRKKDLIKTSGGKFVAPQAVENVLKKNAFVDQAVVIGEGRKFCVVLVVPAVERLLAWADDEGLEAPAGEDAAADAAGLHSLLNDPRCQRHLEEQFYAEMRDLAGFETPKKVGLLTEPLTVENGMLTPTQKVKREAVNRSHADLIDSLYRPDAVDRTMFAG